MFVDPQSLKPVSRIRWDSNIGGEGGALMQTACNNKYGDAVLVRTHETKKKKKSIKQLWLFYAWSKKMLHDSAPPLS